MSKKHTKVVTSARKATTPYMLAVEWDKGVPGSYTAVTAMSPDAQIHRFETGDPEVDFYDAAELIDENPFVEDESLRDFHDHNLAWCLEFYEGYPPACFPLMKKELIEEVVQQAHGQRPRWEWAQNTNGKLYVGPLTLNMGKGGHYDIISLSLTLKEPPRLLVSCQHTVGRARQLPGVEYLVGMFVHSDEHMHIGDDGETPPYAADAPCFDMPPATYAVIACHDQSGLRSFYRIEPVGDIVSKFIH